MRIWKYVLSMADEQTIESPVGAQFLSLQLQHGEPTIWLLCDETREMGTTKVGIFGTGNPMPDHPGKYLGTFQLSDGRLVFHAFQLHE